ncbi:MarR family transcriptional regulator [Ruminococcaceae bacterium OttesenSCG-928-D13]|nr:MarR family transcriptional regulator [Ruminococcaceae bacterium OttesenSCG-928-D13]
MQTFENSMETLIVGIYRDLELLEERMLNASKLNMGIAEIHTLSAVQAEGGEDGATISVLAEHMGITMPSVTAMVNKLEAKGCVQRFKSPSDGRIVQVRLTEKGRRAEVAHRYFHRTLVRAVAAELSEAEKDALMSGVTKLDRFLKDNINKYD